MPGDSITPETADEVAERFAAFVKKKSKKEFYDKLTAQTKTSHVLFMAFAHQLNRVEELISDRYRVAVYLDHFPFPLDNSEIKRQHPGYENRLNVLEAAFAAEERTLGPRPDQFREYLRYIDEAIALHRH
jgi:hypothetical protein